jgi:hypothetical protein
MITGYNTDIEHEGVIYHVQTEDKGLDSPIVLSLVYTGGAILAAKRASYADLIAAGFEESALAERLKRQHRLICAAIHAGRIEELKQLNKGQTGRLVAEHAALMEPEEGLSEKPEESGETAPTSFAELSEQVLTSASHDGQSQGGEITGAAIDQTVSLTGQAAEADLEGPATASPFTVYDSRRRSRLGEVLEEPDGLRITLVGHEPHFYGGEAIQLKAIVTRISNNQEAPLSGATVSIKILGTTFRPVLLSARTDREGVWSVGTRIPPFNSGRAAIVVKVAASDLASEARWVVHPGK